MSLPCHVPLRLPLDMQGKQWAMQLSMLLHLEVSTFPNIGTKCTSFTGQSCAWLRCTRQMQRRRRSSASCWAELYVLLHCLKALYLPSVQQACVPPDTVHSSIKPVMRLHSSTLHERLRRTAKIITWRHIGAVQARRARACSGLADWHLGRQQNGTEVCSSSHPNLKLRIM